MNVDEHVSVTMIQVINISVKDSYQMLYLGWLLVLNDGYGVAAGEIMMGEDSSKGKSRVIQRRQLKQPSSW